MVFVLENDEVKFSSTAEAGNNPKILIPTMSTVIL